MADEATALMLDEGDIKTIVGIETHIGLETGASQRNSGRGTETIIVITPLSMVRGAGEGTLTERGGAPKGGARG